jgi:glyoxylase-like metal-dependent hydrolase (beta-lactamase superfamily II)
MKKIYAIHVVCSFVLFGGFLFGQDNIDFKSTELTPGLHMIEGVGGFAGGNMALSVGEDGVILIDDSLPPLSDKLIAAIAKITDQKVDFVINTHVHGDHTGGNEAFGKAGATIVAHDNIRKRMLEGKPKDALPVLTFAHGLTFHLNGEEARVIHLAKAHTDGDAIIHFPGADVIHTGDICFNGMFPFIDLNSGGSVDGYIAGQEKIITMAGENTKIIPGHGPLATRADLEKNLAVLKDAKKLVAEFFVYNIS